MFTSKSSIIEKSIIIMLQCNMEVSLMNITNVNILELKKKIEESTPLLNVEKEYIDRLIWSFSEVNVDSCDIIMVLGNPTCVELRLPMALKYWRQFPDSRMILCGGVLLPDRNITEAEAMKAACMEAGIQEAKIFLENRSTITKENIEFSAPIVHKLDIQAPHICVISSPTHMRRVKMNLDRFINQYPEGTKMIPIASEVLPFTKDNWLENGQMRKEVSMELGFIHEYLYELGYQAFEF